MYVRVWEYDVDPDRVEEFVRVYGSDGDWARLFARSRGHVSTELYASDRDRTRFVTVDRFTEEADWDAFLSRHRADYDELDGRCHGLALAQRQLFAAES